MTSMREWITRGIQTLSGCVGGLTQNESPVVEFSISKADLESNITRNFKLKELVYSDTAKREGIENLPSTQEQLDNLELVTMCILQPVREYVNKPVIVTSGFRSKELNNLISTNPTSQHTLGQAVDFRVSGSDTRELALWIKENLEFDQLILEHYAGGSSGWIHCSYSSGGNRNQCLTISKSGTVSRGIK